MKFLFTIGFAEGMSEALKAWELPSFWEERREREKPFAIGRSRVEQR